MNPYDFARIDWTRPPQPREPVWHHRLTGRDGQRLYSGSLEVDVIAETPIFIADHGRAAQFMQNGARTYIIPGSSLKGMLRSVVETLGNGCLTLFDGEYEYDKATRRYAADYQRKVPDDSKRCNDTAQLCISCRIFGMLSRGASGVFLGKVNIGDAEAKDVRLSNSIYINGLMGPKPHHRAFYLDQPEQHIAGRKFYFHQLEPLTVSSSTPRSVRIQPLDYGTQFRFRLDFTTLEADEFSAMLFAIVLNEEMRHKIGYGKPLGLGSVHLQPVELTLIDYAARYDPAAAGGGKAVLQGDEMKQEIDRHVAAFRRDHLAAVAWGDLQRIWRWKPDPDVDYYYPSKSAWFDTDESKGKRIADTRNVP